MIKLQPRLQGFLSSPTILIALKKDSTIKIFGKLGTRLDKTYIELKFYSESFVIRAFFWISLLETSFNGRRFHLKSISSYPVIFSCIQVLMKPLICWKLTFLMEKIFKILFRGLPNIFPRAFWLFVKKETSPSVNIKRAWERVCGIVSI